MTRRSGLGKGLSSLIPPIDGGASVADGDAPTLVEIPVADVVPNPNQPRVHFDEETLSELAASIAQLGVLQPVLVRRVGERYQLIAGERRWRAARRAGLTTVPAVVRVTDDVSAVEQALVENLHRAGPHTAGGSRGLPAAHRGLRAHPRRRRPAGRQEPIGDHQHAAPARPAAGRAAPPGRREALGRTCPRPARHTGPLVAGAPGPPGGQRGVVGANRGGVGPQRWGRTRTAAAPAPAPVPPPSTKPATPEPVDGAGLTEATRLRPPGLLELEQLLADVLDTRVGVQMGTKRGRGDDRVRRPRGPRADLPPHRRRALTPAPVATLHRGSTPAVHPHSTVTHSEWKRLWITTVFPGQRAGRRCRLCSGRSRQGRRGPRRKCRDDGVADQRGGIDDVLDRTQRAHHGGHPRLAEDRQAHAARLDRADDVGPASKAAARRSARARPPTDSKPAVA